MGMGCGRSVMPPSDGSGPAEKREGGPKTGLLGSMTRGSAGSAATPALEDDEFFRRLTGQDNIEKASASSASRRNIAPGSGSSESSDKRPPKANASTGMEREGGKQQLTKAAAMHAFRAGVPVPNLEEEEYGILDSYVDDLFEVPQDQRPAGWAPPSLAVTEASLTGDQKDIIFADGRKGKPTEPPPPRERLLDEDPESVGYTVPQKARANTQYLDNVLNGWGAIDALAVRTTEEGGKAPKRKAKKA